MQNADCGLRNENQASRLVPEPGKQLLALIFTAMILAGAPAHAQEVPENEAAVENLEETRKLEEMRSTIDLGTFRVKDLRPTRNETVKLSFAIHLALHPSVSQSTVKQLEHWQHRLRDQVLVVIRLSETKDFLEPNLAKFRRSISLRANRTLKATLVSEALLTEFTFTLN